MLNPFFLQGSTSEQNLIKDLINEKLRMYCVEVYYLPRSYITEKTIIREVIESEFVDAYPLEAYVENYEGYEGNTTILSKFGIQSSQEINLIISQERFETYISPLIKNKPNIKLSSRPKEGDLIYFPLGDRLFEIKFVEHEKPFYQLQKNYVYLLKCELFRYEDEVIDTNLDQIDNNLENLDNIENQFGPTQVLTLVGTGSTATATTSIVNGGIRFITVSNRGGGYTSTPRVAISSAPNGGVTGIATAKMIEGIVVCNDNINPSSKSVQSVEIINPGSGYTMAPSIVFIGDGSGATATSVIGDGIIGAITVTNGGSGYIKAPSVSFTGIYSVSAGATANVSSAGSITSINIINSGLGYTQAPSIQIGSPSIGGTGSFEFNEVITGSVSGTKARVKVWNTITNQLTISNISGEFDIGETVVGSISLASYKIRLVNTNVVDTKYAENSEIQIEANTLIDFSQKNPFGVP